MRRFLLAVMLLAAGVASAAPSFAPRLVAAQRHGVVVLSALNQAVSFASPEEIEEPMPVPASLPITAQDLAAATRAVQPLATLQPIATAPPVVARSFVAFRDDNTTRPPDTHGAVGPNHVLTATNAAIVVHNREGAALSTASLDNFFLPVRESTHTFDPRVIYDRFDGRWILTAAAGSRSALSAALLAVSRTSDPTGTWDLFRYAADSTGKVWFDFPAAGVNERFISLTGNMYTVTDSKFDRAVVFVFDKANLAAPAARFDPINSGGSITPVVNFDAGVTTLYFVQRWNGNSNGRGFLRLYIGSTVALTPVAFISSPTPWSTTGNGEEDFAPQQGSAIKIDTGDDRIGSAVYRNGSIWTAHTIFLPVGAPTRAAVQWFQISPTGISVQRGTFEDETNVFFYAFPSVAVNRRNDILIGLSRFSADTPASAGFGFRSGSATNFTLEIFKPGEAPYAKVGTTGNRWGDYSATAVDPRNDTDFWTIQEFAGAPVNTIDRWGTWWAQVIPPLPTARGRAVRH